MRRKTEQRLRQTIAFVGCVLFLLLPGPSCSRHGASTPARAKEEGRVTIVYQDDAILPENCDAIKKIRDSGVFERMAERLTNAVALPHDLQVIEQALKDLEEENQLLPAKIRQIRGGQ